MEAGSEEASEDGASTGLMGGLHNSQVRIQTRHTQEVRRLHPSYKQHVFLHLLLRGVVNAVLPRANEANVSSRVGGATCGYNVVVKKLNNDLDSITCAQFIYVSLRFCRNKCKSGDKSRAVPIRAPPGTVINTPQRGTLRSLPRMRTTGV